MNLNLDQIPSILRGRAGRIKANDKRKLRVPESNHVRAGINLQRPERAREFSRCAPRLKLSVGIDCLSQLKPVTCCADDLLSGRPSIS